MIDIPKKLPLSGRGGAERLKRLVKRAEFLKARIDSERFKDLSHDKAELSALDWVIRQMILYEGLLKKGPEEPQESEMKEVGST